MEDFTVFVDGQQVRVEISRKTLVWDLACQLEEKGYEVDVAHPKVTEDGEKVDGTNLIKRISEYHFSKLGYLDFLSK
jgi:hypothetical protein